MFSVMRIVLLMLVVLVILPSVLSAQAPDTLWTRYYYNMPYNDLECWDMIETEDSALVIVGTAQNPEYPSYIFIMKINFDGDTLWTRTYHDSTTGHAICSASDGGFVISGNTVVNGTYPYLMKIDSEGNEEWTQYYSDFSYGNLRSVQPVSDNGFILTGYLGPLINEDILLVRVNSNGDTLWSKVYGGSENERAWSAKETSDNGFIVAGWTESYGLMADIYIIKTDSIGDTLWTRNYGYTWNDEAREIIETEDGGYVIAGKGNEVGGGTGSKYYLMKIDAQGDSLWAHFYSREYSNIGVFHSFTSTNDDGYILFGYSTLGTIDLFKTNSNGDSLWYLNFDYNFTNSRSRKIVRVRDNSYFLCGYHYINKDIWVVRLASEPVGIDEQTLLPQTTTLRNNYPNPFNASTTISYSISNAQNISLIIYDLLGREIETLVDEFKETGEYSIIYNADNLSSGVYFYRLKTDNCSESKIMTLLK